MDGQKQLPLLPPIAEAIAPYVPGPHQTHKDCGHCARHNRFSLRPLEEFRQTKPSRYNPDGRFRICRLCEEALYADMRAQARALAREKTVEQGLAEVRRGPTPSVVNIADLMVQRMGGLEATVDEMIAQYEAAALAEPGSTRVLNFWQSMMKFHLAAQEHRPPEKDLGTMTEEEIEAEIIELRVLSVRADSPTHESQNDGSRDPGA